jgi:hypothetical protein
VVVTEFVKKQFKRLALLNIVPLLHTQFLLILCIYQPLTPPFSVLLIQTRFGFWVPNRDWMGWTPFMLAIERNLLTIMEYLHKYGANVNHLARALPAGSIPSPLPIRARIWDTIIRGGEDIPFAIQHSHGHTPLSAWTRQMYHPDFTSFARIGLWLVANGAHSIDTPLTRQNYDEWKRGLEEGELKIKLETKTAATATTTITSSSSSDHKQFVATGQFRYHDPVWGPPGTRAGTVNGEEGSSPSILAKLCLFHIGGKSQPERDYLIPLLKAMFEPAGM